MCTTVNKKTPTYTEEIHFKIKLHYDYKFDEPLDDTPIPLSTTPRIKIKVEYNRTVNFFLIKSNYRNLDFSKHCKIMSI